MPVEPKIKRVITFFDGQNLFHSASSAFGYTFPNYDVIDLSKFVVATQAHHGWKLEDIRFYTGVPPQEERPDWFKFWSNKTKKMAEEGVVVTTRGLKVRSNEIVSPSGEKFMMTTFQEKGIDLLIAMDIVRLARSNSFDVAVIFSQDQDLAEVASEVRTVSFQEDRWIKVASAYPISDTYTNRRGINGTDWMMISKKSYDQCIDPTNYTAL